VSSSRIAAARSQFQRRVDRGSRELFVRPIDEVASRGKAQGGSMRHGTSAVWIAVAFVALASSGCSKSHNGSSSGAVKPLLAGFNAASDMPDVTFLREEEVWSSMAFGVATAFRGVDQDQYDIHFDSLLPGDMTTTCAGDVNKDGVKDANECTRVATQPINVLNGHEYIVALLGHYNALSVHVYDDTPHVFDNITTDGDGIDTNLQVQVFNWSSSLGPVDVYIEPPGTNLSVTQVKATLAAGDEFNGLVDSGVYVLTLTPVANPGSPVYTSENFTLSPQTRVGFALLDGTNNLTTNVRVSRFRDQGGDLLDRRAQTFMRAAHVSPNVGNVDIYAQETYTTPLYSNVALNQQSAYTVIDPTWLSSLELDVTPAGNPGVLLTRDLLTLTKGERATFFLVQTATGGVNGINGADDARRLAPYAQLRPVNSFGASLDFFVIPHGNNVYTSTPNQTLSTGSIGGFLELGPGSYDIIVAKAGTDTFVYGPKQVDLAGNGIYTIVAVPTAQVTSADLLLLDDFTQ
jgi:hypothetical protein